jgi:hypothetical protein
MCEITGPPLGCNGRCLSKKLRLTVFQLAAHPSWEVRSGPGWGLPCVLAEAALLRAGGSRASVCWRKPRFCVLVEAALLRAGGQCGFPWYLRSRGAAAVLHSPSHVPCTPALAPSAFEKNLLPATSESSLLTATRLFHPVAALLTYWCSLGMSARVLSVY